MLLLLLLLAIFYCCGTDSKASGARIMRVCKRHDPIECRSPKSKRRPFLILLLLLCHCKKTLFFFCLCVRACFIGHISAWAAAVADTQVTACHLSKGGVFAELLFKAVRDILPPNGNRSRAAADIIKCHSKRGHFFCCCTFTTYSDSSIHPCVRACVRT